MLAEYYNLISAGKARNISADRFTIVAYSDIDTQIQALRWNKVAVGKGVVKFVVDLTYPRFPKATGFNALNPTTGDTSL